MNSRFSFISIAIFLLASCAAPQASPTPVIVQVPITATPVPSPTITLTPSPAPTATLPYHFPAIRTPEALEPLTGDTPVEFHIFHLNDFHAELIQNYTDGEWIPGAARLQTVLQQEKSRYDPASILLLDAGDWVEGTNPAFPVKPLDVMEVYKMLGVNAATTGNHEFFLGLEPFFEVLQDSPPVEILSDNFRLRASDGHCMEDQRVVNAYKIYELGKTDGEKVRVAVIGLDMRDLQRQAPSPLPGICFHEPKPGLVALYDQLQANEKPDLFVLLTHIGYDGDQMLADYMNSQGKPIDLIIGGHSHSWIESPKLVGKTVVVTAGSRGMALGELDLTYNRKTDTLTTHWNLLPVGSCVPQDATITDYLKQNFPSVYSTGLNKYQIAPQVGITFDVPTVEDGIVRREEKGDDGSTQKVTIGGKSAVVNVEGSYYIYFGLDDLFYYGCPRPVEVTVEYFDQGYGPLYIEYDRGPEGGRPQCAECYSPKFITNLVNTKTWKTVSVKLSDATFFDNMKWGTDFRITADQKPFYLHSVTVSNLETGK